MKSEYGKEWDEDLKEHFTMQWQETYGNKISGEYLIVDGNKVSIEKAKADFLEKGYTEEQWSKYLKLIRSKDE